MRYITGRSENVTDSDASVGWDTGFAVPSAETNPRGIDIKPNGDIVIVGSTTDKVYTYSDDTWDTGIAVPASETNPQAVAVKPNGDLVIVGSAADKVYTYSDDAWDAGFAVPSAETMPQGIAVDPNGLILMVGYTADKVYTYSGAEWDAGIDVPAAVNTPVGLSVDPQGNPVVLDDPVATGLIYTLVNGAWRTSYAIPAAETGPTDIAIKPNGDVLLVGLTTDKIYTYTVPSYDARQIMDVDESILWIRLTARGPVSLIGCGLSATNTVGTLLPVNTPVEIDTRDFGPLTAGDICAAGIGAIDWEAYIE